MSKLPALPTTPQLPTNHSILPPTPPHQGSLIKTTTVSNTIEADPLGVNKMVESLQSDVGSTKALDFLPEDISNIFCKNEAEKIYEKALVNEDKESARGQYEEALRLIKQAIKIAPKYRWQHYDQGVYLAALGRFEESAKSFSQEIILNLTRNAQLYSRYERASVYLKMGKRDLARADFESVSKLVGFSDERMLADVSSKMMLISKQEHDESVAKVEKAEAEAKTKAEAEAKTKAEAASRAAAEPPHNEAYYNKLFLESFRKAEKASDSQEKKAGYEKALEYINRAIELNPKGRWNHHNRGNIRRDTGLYELALADYVKEIEMYPNAESYYEMAMVYSRMGGRNKETLDAYTQAINLDSKIRWNHHNRGNVCRDMGLYELALADYAKEIEMYPNAESYHEMARVYSKIDERNQEAVDAFTKAIELNPKRLWQYFDRGMVYYQMGRKEEALKDFAAEKEINSRPSVAHQLKGISDEIELEKRDMEQQKFNRQLFIVAGALGTFLYLYMMVRRHAQDRQFEVPNNLPRPQKDQDFIPKNNRVGAIKFYARSAIEVMIGTYDTLSEEDRRAFLMISDELFTKVFKAITTVKYETEIFPLDLEVEQGRMIQNECAVVNFRHSDGSIKERIIFKIDGGFNGRISFGSLPYEKKYEVMKKALNGFVSGMLKDFPDGEEKDGLKKMLSESIEAFKGYTGISGSNPETSFLYNFLLKDGVKHTRLDREKYQEALEIFSEEAYRYFIEIRTQVVMRDLAEKLLDGVLEEVATQLTIKDVVGGLLNDVAERAEKETRDKKSPNSSMSGSAVQNITALENDRGFGRRS